MRTFVSLFSKAQYDFALNHEIPLINPFKYFGDVTVDVLVMNLGNFEDLELAQLSFSVVELLIIVTQANYREDEMLAYQKLLSHHARAVQTFAAEDEKRDAPDDYV